MIDAVRLSAIVVLGGALAGCVETSPILSGDDGRFRAEVTAGSIAVPRNATVAVATLEGAPDGVIGRFNQAFVQTMIARGIGTTAPDHARYLVRGYLDAAAGEAGSGTDVSVVLDVFDGGDRARLARVSETLTVAGTGQDPWSAVDDRVLAGIAGRATERLAGTLATLPSQTLADAGLQRSGTAPAR